MFEHARVEVKENPENPSLLRHGPINKNLHEDWREQMLRMFERWAYVLGTTPYNDPDLQEGCLKDLPKLHFYYGDPESGIAEDDGMEGRADVHTLAYRFEAPDGNEDGKLVQFWQSNLSCPRINYRQCSYV